MFRGYGSFIREFFRTSYTTGAVLPSGPSLCRALAAYVNAEVDERGRPRRENPEEVRAARRILEIGPGTGCVTRVIAQRLGPEDTLDLIECNPVFVKNLRRMMERDPVMRPVADRVRIFECYVQDHPVQERYERIISGLPLNNFPAELVSEILSHFRRLSAPGGTVSWFEYIAIRRMKSMVSFGSDGDRLRGITAALEAVLKPYEFRRQAIPLNVPPAWVHHVRFTDENEQDRENAIS
ncbi:MAG: methyltransferase domain-containing protein [Planctomycetia bacterium]|nr:methyltransferase domain-containing protein [Planctomycetia bacterium]